MEASYPVVDFWLDTDIFIAAKNGPYGFDIAPGFWTLIDQKAHEGVISSSMLVYHELVDESDDDLAKWAKQRSDTGLFVDPDQAVQDSFRAIADYVKRTYIPSQAAGFLRGADPWIIAQARALGGKVVTLEVRTPSSSKRVKIPNVCDYFNIECTDTYKMLRSLGAALHLS